jgi:hypothetical protein
MPRDDDTPAVKVVDALTGMTLAIAYCKNPLPSAHASTMLLPNPGVVIVSIPAPTPPARNEAVDVDNLAMLGYVIWFVAKLPFPELVHPTRKFEAVVFKG